MNATSMVEALLLQPLFEPLENEMGPVASTLFSSLLEREFERIDG